MSVAEAPAAGSTLRAVEWPVRAGAVPPLAEAFTGRPDTVPGIEAKVAPGTAVALVPDGEAAGGGCSWRTSCGKTQLASYLAGALWKSREVDLLAWVTAASRDSVLSGYAAAAAGLGLDDGGDAESVAARFAAWLASTARPWLLVLDDLRDAGDLDGLWPGGGSAGRLLVTAADAGVVPEAARASVVPVPPFSQRESMAYMRDRLTTYPEHRSGAYELTDALGGEPSALGQAGAVMAGSGTSCRNYERYLRQARERLPAAGQGPAADATWVMSADYAEALLPGGGTWRLLVLLALLDGHGVPAAVLAAPALCEFLAEARPGSSPGSQAATEAARALERAGLAASAPPGEDPALTVARPLQAAVRAAAPPGLLSRAVRAAADAVLQAWPDDQPRTGPAAQLRACAASLLAHAGDALWEGGSCHRVLLAAGHSLARARLTGPAAAWWREVTVRCERLLPEGHPDTLVAAGQLADALLAAGQAPGAVRCARWTLAGRERALGPDHPAVVAAMTSLGRALSAAGDAGEAVTVLQQAAGRSERAHGPGDPGTLAVLDAQAAACLAAGDTSAAVRHCKRALAGYEQLHGAASPAALAAAQRLAGACLADGKARSAVAACKGVLGARERVLGAGHPDTLAARSSLAFAYDAAGQLGAALQEHQQAAGGYDRLLGPDHPVTLASRGNLAGAYYSAGQAGDAIALLHDSIPRSERAASPADPVTAGLRRVLASISDDMAAG